MDLNWLAQSSHFTEEFYYFDEKSFVCRILISDHKKNNITQQHFK